MKKFKNIIFTVITTVFTFCSLCAATPNALEETSSQATSLTNGAPAALTSPAVNMCTTSIADIVEPLKPAVVNVYTSQNVKSSQMQRMPFPEGSPFEQFNDFFEQFNGPLNPEENYSNPKATSLGSGFIIDPAGYIVTNFHVINDADEIYVKLADNTELPAKLIGSDKRTDLALLKVEAKNELPFVKFGDSSKARVGDMTFTIGNPFGFGGTVTSGIISSKGRDINVDSSGVVDDFIQTDAAINRGNSGGPLFNMQGEVVGVNTAIYSPSGTNIGIGFAIPSLTAESIVGQLMKGGKINRGRLDINIQPITPEIAEGLGIKQTDGVLIAEVIPGGAGDKAGLKSGDIVLEFNGQVIKTPRKLQISVAETPVNKDVKMTILRANKKQELTLQIFDQDTDKKLAANKNDHLADGSFKKNDFTFKNFTSAIRQEFGIKEDITGVIITAVPAKQKPPVSLKVGDIIVNINQQPVRDIAGLKKMFEDAKMQKKQNVVLLIKRRDRNVISTFIATMPLN